jgi:hypothetical protein
MVAKLRIELLLKKGGFCSHSSWANLANIELFVGGFDPSAKYESVGMSIPNI